MLGKIIYVLVKKCSSGWRYDESSCYFNVRVMLAIFFSFNLISIFLFFFPKAVALKLTLFGSNYPFYLKFAYPLFFFILLSVLYPKKKIQSNYSMTPDLEKSLGRGYWVYCIATIGLLITLAVVKF